MINLHIKIIKDQIMILNFNVLNKFGFCAKTKMHFVCIQFLLFINYINQTLFKNSQLYFKASYFFFKDLRLNSIIIYITKSFLCSSYN